MTETTVVKEPVLDGDPFKKADSLRLEGNSLFAKGNFADASRLYQEGLLAVVRCGGEDTARATEVRGTLHLNASLSELRRGNLGMAVEHASGALAADPRSAKALYRRGLARSKLGEHRGHESERALAVKDLESALEIEPGNAEVWSQLKILRADIKAGKKDLDKSQKENFKGIFSGAKALYDDPEPVEAEPVLRGEGGKGDERPLALTADGLTFAYFKEAPVLVDASVDLYRGWCVGIVGNNAEGKTTLARILNGKLSPTRGRVVHHVEPGAGSQEEQRGGGASKLTLVALNAVVVGVAVVMGMVGGGKFAQKWTASLQWWHWLLMVTGLGAVLLAVNLVASCWRSPFSTGGAKLRVVHVSSEGSDKEEIADKRTIEDAIGEKLPKSLSKDQRRSKVVAMLKAGCFQMYNQETGTEVGSPEEYLENRLQYGQLSGGQKHLIYILRCIASRPDVLLCDEVLGGLDQIRAPRVLHMLRRLKCDAGTSILYISCELNQQRIVADDMAFLKGGRFVELGPIEEVLDFPRHPATKDYVGQYRSMPGCSKIGGKLAEAYEGLKGDEALAGPWLPAE